MIPIFSAYSDTLSVFTEIINNQLYITSDQDYNGESLITVVVEDLMMLFLYFYFIKFKA